MQTFKITPLATITNEYNILEETKQISHDQNYQASGEIMQNKVRPSKLTMPK